MSLMIRPYQLDGAAFLASRTHAGLFDTMGLGKTPQALLAAQAVGAQRILVVAPLSTLENFRREIAKFWPDAPAATVCRRHDALPKAGPGVTLVPWTDLAYRHDRGDFAAADPYDLLIADEAHRAKGGSDTQVGQAFLGYFDRNTKQWVKGVHEYARRVWLLSGTPLPNGRAAEALPILAVCGVLRRRGMKWTEFLERYARRHNPHHPRGFDLYGNRDPEAIRGMLAECSLRRKAEDVPGQLPALNRREVFVPLGAQAPEWADADEQEAAEFLLTNNDWETDERAFGHAAARLARYRRRLGELKAGPAARWVVEWIEDYGQAVVVFVHHHSVGHAVAAALSKALGEPIAYLSGEQTVEERQAAIDAFRRQDGPKAIVLGIDACGIGINGLQERTNAAVFVESSWSPASLDQAEGRIRRIGCVGSEALVYYLVADELDERIARALNRKRALAEASTGTTDAGAQAAGVPLEQAVAEIKARAAAAAAAPTTAPAAAAAAAAAEAPAAATVAATAPVRQPTYAVPSATKYPWSFRSITGGWAVSCEARGLEQLDSETLAAAWRGVVVPVVKRSGERVRVKLGALVRVDRFGATFAFTQA